METLKNDQGQEIKIGKGWRELIKEGIANTLFNVSLIDSLKFIQTNGTKRFERKAKRRRRKSTLRKRV